MASRKKETVLDYVLEYHGRGWCIIPIGHDKKPPKGFKWKQYQTSRPDEAQLREWFGNGKYKSFAAVCGAVSGGLAVLDLDSEQRCEWWRREHSKLAETLPTSRTENGIHAYFRSEPFPVRHGDQVDLLGERAYAILPPSPNKEWIHPLDGELPLLDPFEWGLEQFGIKPPKAAGLTEHTEPTEQTDTVVLRGISKKEVLLLINKTLPQKYRERNGKIFYLALGLKSMPGYWNANPKDFLWVVREWHRRALPNIRTKDFLDTWVDLLAAWRNIKYKNIDPKQIFELCKELAPPLQLLRDHPEWPALHQLCVWCRELQKAHAVFGTTPYLACRKIGKVLGISHETANKYFRILDGERYIEIASKGGTPQNPRKATRFRYIGD